MIQSRPEALVATVVLGYDCKSARPNSRIVASGSTSSAAIDHVSGSLEMRDELVAVAVPPEQLMTETASKTTHEQAANVARIVAARFARFDLPASMRFTCTRHLLAGYLSSSVQQATEAAVRTSARSMVRNSRRAAIR